jgi:hypothetical protein
MIEVLKRTSNQNQSLKNGIKPVSSLLNIPG